MNKKNLSVVMAGAMLATSVAPVLADTTTETNGIKEYTVNNSNKGNLISELRSLLNGKKFDNIVDNGVYAGKSVYAVKIKDENGYTKGYTWSGSTQGTKKTVENYIKSHKLDTLEYEAIKDNSTGTDYRLAKVPVYDNTNLLSLENAIKSAGEGYTVEVWNRGFREENGSIYSYAKDAIEEDVLFTSTDLENEVEKFENGNYPAVYDMSYNNGVLTVYARTAEDESKHLKLTYKAGYKKVDFSVPVNVKGEEVPVSSVSDPTIVGFKTVKKVVAAKDSDIPDYKVAEIKISNYDKEYITVLSKLYDGLFLTEDGQKLYDTIKEYKANGDIANVDYAIEDEANGIYSFEVRFEKKVANGKSERYVVRITSNNKEQLELFRKWMWKSKVPVQKLSGNNRYETAVKVAKENADITTVTKNGNIVLVNGDSLVDGLAAAPLAASVRNLDNDGYDTPTDYVAPILLTETNGIPKATKDYMRELIGQQEVQHLDKITVYLVGGEAVISKSVENQLKEIGFRVVRAGGADREETSLKVAELMAKDGNTNINGNVGLDNAFLVGANGEADAMSIAPVAAANRTPIIVESVHGISDDTISYLEGYKDNKLKGKNVTIVGGESAVSATTEKVLVDKKLKVERVAGENRKATNAKIINTYYGKTGMVNGVLPINPGFRFNNVLVSKDGMNKEGELIDALTATSLAVKHESPIVLATNKLSDEQINVLELNASRSGIYVYQVGEGVAREVIKTIAERINLAK